MIKKIWLKIKEYFLYLLFGGLTTVVNYAVYLLLLYVFKMQSVLLVNAIAWVAAVAFAYVTNKIWVFESKAKGIQVLREIGEFVLGRLLTLGIEELMLWVFCDIMNLNNIVIKLIASVVTIVLNYVFSKFIIFKKK